MRVLLVGASGFIGKNLALKLPRTWNAVGTFNLNTDFPKFVAERDIGMQTVHLDLRDRSMVEKVLKKLGPFDACVYLAADNDTRQLIEHPRRDVENNVMPLLNILDFYQGGRFVYLSSGSVYTGLSGPVSPKTRVDPSLSFTIGRFSCERYVKCYARAKKNFDTFTIIRFFGAYGNLESPRKITPRLIQALANGREATFTIFGDGENYIDLMNVSDAAEAILGITASKHTDLELDLCFGEHRTLNQYVETVAGLLKSEVKIRHEGKSLEYIRFYASTSQLTRTFGFKPRTGLREGVHEYAHALFPARF